MDLDAIWYVRLWGPMTHYISQGFSTTQEKGRLEVEPSARTVCNCKLQLSRQIYAATW